MKMKPTPGPWIVDTWAIYSAVQLDETGKTQEMPILEGGSGRDADGLDNLKLAAEAGTVHHETGLSPRELLEQRDDAIRHLRELLFCGPTKSAQAELTARAFFVTIAATRETKGEG